MLKLSVIGICTLHGCNKLGQHGSKLVCHKKNIKKFSKTNPKEKL
jgi:hypothetical protein